MPYFNDLEKKKVYTVKPLITNTSEEFIKCRLDNEFYTILRKFHICENK